MVGARTGAPRGRRSTAPTRRRRQGHRVGRVSDRGPDTEGRGHSTEGFRWSVRPGLTGSSLIPLRRTTPFSGPLVRTPVSWFTPEFPVRDVCRRSPVDVLGPYVCRGTVVTPILGHLPLVPSLLVACRPLVHECPFIDYCTTTRPFDVSPNIYTKVIIYL